MLTHSAALVGLLGIVELEPLIVVCSLLGGAMADRVDDRRKLMLAGQAAVVAIAAAIDGRRDRRRPAVALIFLLAALLAGGSTIDNVSRSAIIPALAGDRLCAALSLTTACTRSPPSSGPGLGGL